MLKNVQKYQNSCKFVVRDGEYGTLSYEKMR